MRRRELRRVRRWLLGAVAVVAAGVALATGPGGLLERAELVTHDLRFAVRGEREPPRDLVVVGIDVKTFSDLGLRYPFSRRVFARALNRVAAQDPRLVVYDVQFTEASGNRPADIAADNALLLAVRRAGNVVLSTTEVAEDGSTNVFGGETAQRFARATVGSGLLPEDADRVVRRIERTVNGLDALAVAAVRRLGRPVDRDGFGPDGAWIDFAGPARHLDFVSFSDALRGRGDFRDRIVVIGATAPSLQDRHPTAWPGETMSGPEIQATAIDTLLRGIPLRSSAGWVDWLLAIALSVLGPLAGLRLRPGYALAGAVGAALLYVVAVQVAFGAGRILPLVAPLTGLLVGVVGALAVHYLTATVERAQIRDVFARFVPDSVVSEVLDRAGGASPRLGGVRLLCTVMFSDLRGFTTFAEEREPEEVIEVLNRHLSLMSDAILDHGGTLVAYLGDGIMALFGAPIGSGDHAERALAAGRAMIARMEEFNAWVRERGLGDGFKLGVGLNTGEVLSGNVGSERRLEYTAIGDTTNTAARLEGMTKGTPYQLFLSASTRSALRAVPDDLERVGELEVRGRRGTLEVWGLRPSAARPSRGRPPGGREPLTG